MAPSQQSREYEEYMKKMENAQVGMSQQVIQEDRWSNRNQGMKCSTCMWFVRKGILGRCRRHAPSMNGYPVVYPTEWCGDHKHDETKV